jgi:membrane protease YdiL (CAAX protease family)
LLAAVTATLVAATVVSVIAIAAGANARNPPPAVAIIGTYLEDAALIAAALVFASLRGRPRPAQFGLRAPRVLRALGWALLGAVAYFAFSVAWQNLLDLHEKDNLPQQLGADRSTSALVAVVVLVCVVAPIAEELFFRGFFFSALRRWSGPWVAAALTGLVFGAAHAVGSPIGFLVPLAFLGFVLSVVRWRTGSLYPGIAMHALNNGLAFGVLRHWNAGQVVLLMLGSLVTVAAIVLPLARIASRTTVPSRTVAAS